MTSKKWEPDSWKTKIALQQPNYDNTEELEKIISEIKILPPIVFEDEVDDLKKKLALAEKGKMFILQGGDCVEGFADCNETTILNKIKILLQMSIIITYAAKIPVLKIGRIAGVHAKPRSNEYEYINENSKIPSYKGDSINSFMPVLEERIAKPFKLKESYFHSAATLNYIRAIIRGGFADLHQPSKWDIDFIEQAEQSKEYKSLINNVLDSIVFLECFGGVNSEILNCTDFYISHEGLLLSYEESMTRKSKISESYYNLGTHMLWIGERTRNINNAHVEYFRGIKNPIGIKVSSKIEPEELIKLLDIVNPLNESGKICLITRMGHQNVKTYLPNLIKAVQKSNKNVTWICDPMHGNTVTTTQNLKTRLFDDILSELIHTFNVHKEMGSFMSGVHFELTGDHVTECIGGGSLVDEESLIENYQTFCDPRLNYSQSMEISFLLAKLLNENKNEFG